MTAPPVTLRSPAELLAVIPHLLGFEPRQSIVVVAIRNNKIGLTQRMDLPALDRVEEVAETLVGHVLRDAAAAALLVGYEDTAGEALALTEALTERLQERQVSVRDRIAVHDRRWRSLDCDDPSCCPAGGTPLPTSTQVASAVAEFIGQGSAPLPDRQALADQVEPSPAADEVAELLQGARAVRTTVGDGEARRRLAGVWARVLTVGGNRIKAADAAVALRSLADISMRDGIVSLLVPSSLDLEALPDHIRSLLQEITAIREDREADPSGGATKARLIALCQHAPDDHAAPALTLLATYSWWHGDGALARVALDRALGCDPDYRLAQLLTLMLDEGIRPDRP